MNKSQNQHGRDNHNLTYTNSSNNYTILPTYKPEPEEVPYLAAVVYYKTEFVISNLKHFQEYSIEVVACQEIQPNMTEKFCSNRAITTARTIPRCKSSTFNPYAAAAAG